MSHDGIDSTQVEKKADEAKLSDTEGHQQPDFGMAIAVNSWS